MKQGSDALYWILLSLCLLMTSLYFFARQSSSIHSYQEKIQASVLKKEQKIARFLDQIQVQQADSSQWDQWSNLDFQVYEVQNEQIRFWNSTQVCDSLLVSLNDFSGRIVSPNGIFAYNMRTSQQQKFIAAFPINTSKRAFSIQESPSPYPIYNQQKQTIAFLSGPAYAIPIPTQFVLFILFIGILVGLVIVLNRWAIHLSKTHGPWLGAIFLLSIILLLRLLSIAQFAAITLPDLSLLHQAFSIQVLNTSLGDLFINSIVLLWLMSFFHREFELYEHLQIPAFSQWILSLFNYLSIILGFIIVTNLLQSFVLDSGLTFDFDNIFQLNSLTLLAMLSAIFLLFAFFLFTHRMMLTLVRIGLERNYRLRVLIIAVLLIMPILVWISPNLPIFQMILATLIYILLFDLFVEHSTPSLTWLFIWVVFFAAFASVSLFKFNLDKDRAIRLSYAKELSHLKDTLAEQNLETLKTELSKNSTDSLEDRLKTILPNLPYLNFNYQYEISNEPFVTFNPQNGNYHLRIDSTRFLQFRPHFQVQQYIYHNILPKTNYKNLQLLTNYDFQISKDGQTLWGKGKIAVFPKTPEIGQSTSSLSSHYASLSYRSKEGVLVTIEKELGGYIKPMSLFSYLFVLLLFCSLLLLLLARSSQSLPESLHFPILIKPSLRNRIQLAVITLIIGSFFIIGWVTVSFFQQSSNKTNEKRLLQKVGTVLRDLEHELQLITPQNDSLLLQDIAKPISDIHHIDLHIFGLDGKLNYSSAEFIFQKGILANRMHPKAYHQLSIQNKKLFIQKENIQNQIFKTVYLPLRTNSNAINAYLSIPYYSSDSSLEQEVSDFMGALLNVYVFLLLLAGVIAIAVANSITQPISTIGERLTDLKLGRNEALEWNSQDEIGDLVNAYNTMIEELEASTEKLKQSEREGAWREMAKQVAHEIKNPLTPMKLSIQYLMHVAKSDPARAESMLAKVSQTLIEQIEGLARIATEFSNFAKMPTAKNSHFILNDVVQSVYNLFTQVPEDHLSIQLAMPDKNFPVFADRENLMRVLNNLIKNAIQAIPDEKEGQIKVQLYPQNKMAIIAVQDNGTGISDELKEKVFRNRV